MKKMLLPAMLSINAFCFSQNVGVGTHTPSQRLDVNGNINTSGNLMVNGVTGANGQVLAMNGNTMQWMDRARFDNWALFATPGSTSFSVPAGVSEIMIEIWGAGGGPHVMGGGGGSGGYWTGMIPVTGGTTVLTLTIGAPGTGGVGATPAGDGGDSGFAILGFGSVTVEGGSGADSSLIGTIEVYRGGKGGRANNSMSLPPTLKSFYYVNGNDGTPTTVSFVQTSTGVFTRLYTGGVGGVAPFSGQQPAATTAYLDFAAGGDIRSNGTGIGGPGIGQGGTTDVKFSSSIGGVGGIIIRY